MLRWETTGGRADDWSGYGNASVQDQTVMGSRDCSMVLAVAISASRVRLAGWRGDNGDRLRGGVMAWKVMRKRLTGRQLLSR